MAKQQHIVTGVRPFNFKDDNGNFVQGVTVFYLDTVNEDSDFGKGHAALNLTLIGDHVSKFKTVPAVYELNFRQARDSKGRPTLRLDDAEFIQPFNLEFQEV